MSHPDMPPNKSDKSSELSDETINASALEALRRMLNTSPDHGFRGNPDPVLDEERARQDESDDEAATQEINNQTNKELS